MGHGLGNGTRFMVRPLAYSDIFNDSSSNVKYLGWNIPIESLHIVHPYWRGFLAPPDYYNALFFIIYLGLLLSSLFGNGLVLWIFSTSKVLRTPSNLLIVNLAIYDLFMTENSAAFLTHTFAGHVMGGDFGCRIYAFMGGIAGMGAASTNAMIAFDRYRTISSPLEGRLNFFQAGMLVMFTWFWTLPMNIMPFFKIWGRFLPEGYLTTCSFDYLTDNDETRNFVFTIFIWAYAIPMIFICIFYSKLFFHVRAHEQMLQEQAKKMNVKSLSANPTGTNVELRIAKAAFVIYFLFVCAWTPYGIISITGAFGNRNLITPFSAMLPAMASKTVSCIDPWIYAASHPKYRLELEKRVPWLGVREKNYVPEAENKSVTTTSEVEAS